MIARDGEGATKLVECALTGAKTQAAADAVSKAVICSSLVKAAMFGSDANWGRVLCAIGYAGADVDVNKGGRVFPLRRRARSCVQKRRGRGLFRGRGQGRCCSRTK